MSLSERSFADRIPDRSAGISSGAGLWNTGESAPLSRARSLPHRWWLHLLLFFATLLTTTTFGSALSSAFNARQPLNEQFLWSAYLELFHGSPAIWSGLLYSVPLLIILLAHEFGHYIAAKRSGVEATLPFFWPSPTLLGTLGAIILMRSPIYNRKSLFDIGASGPIAGFIALLPFLITGISLSTVVHGAAAAGPFIFGTPLLMRIVEWVRFPGINPANILVHPMAMAAWAGLLTTAMNLLPAGQLDGGHILYSLFGERKHRIATWLVIAGLAVCGTLYWPWWAGAVALILVRRHPLIYSQDELGRVRRSLAAFTFMILLLAASLVPVQLR